MFDFKDTPWHIGPSKGKSAQEALLTAAMEEFGLCGLEGARTRSIAEKAGQNLGSISYYFKNKEGMYLALVEGTTRFFVKQLAPRLEAMDAFMASNPDPDAETLTQALIKVMSPLIEMLIARDEYAPFSLIILREQMRPTQAFDIFFERTMKPLHQRVCRVVAKATGLKADSEFAIAHSHALIGEVVVFRFAREALLRRTGWDKITPERMNTIRTVIHDSLKASLTGLIANASQPRP